MRSARIHSITSTIVKFWLWAIGLLLIIYVGGGLALQQPRVQTYLAGFSTDYLTKKLNTRVVVKYFTTDWHNQMVFKGIYLQDQERDTLLYAGELAVNISLFKLLDDQIQLNDITLQDGYVKITSSEKDSTYNYQFLLASLAGKKHATNTTARKSHFDFTSLVCENVTIKVEDSVRGNFIAATAQNLEIQKEKSLLKPGPTKFSEIIAKGLDVRFIKTKASSGTKNPGFSNFDFDNLQILNSTIAYQNKVTSETIDLKIGEAQIAADSINFSHQKIALSRANFINCSAAFYKEVGKNSTAGSGRHKLKTKLKPDQIKPSGIYDWDIAIKDIETKNLAIAYRNGNELKSGSGVDFNNVKVSGVSALLQKLSWQKKSLSVFVQRFQLTERSGFRIKDFAGQFTYAGNQLALQKFTLVSGASKLGSSVKITFPKATQKGNFDNDFFLEADLKNTHIGPQDLNYFKQYLYVSKNVKSILQYPVMLDGNFVYSKSRFSTDHLHAKILTKTEVTFAGTSNRPKTKGQANISVTIQDFFTTSADLNTLLPANTIPAGYTLPASLNISGKANLAGDNLMLRNFRINGSDGQKLHTSGEITGIRNSKKAVDLTIHNYNTSGGALRRMLPEKSIHPDIRLPESIQISGRFKASSINDLNTKLSAVTTYGKMGIDLKLSPNQTFAGTVTSDNFNLGKLINNVKQVGKASGTLNFKGTGFERKTMVVSFEAEIDRIYYRGTTYTYLDINGTMNRSELAVRGSLAKGILQMVGGEINKISLKKIYKKGKAGYKNLRKFGKKLITK